MSCHDDEDHSEDSISGQSSIDDIGSSTAPTTSGRLSNSDDNKVKFVEKESRYVYILRLCVLLVLVLAAAVSVMVYFISTKGEDQAYQHDYESAANKVVDTFMDIATYDMGAAGSMVVAIVANGLALDRSWPFVTITSFQERADMVKRLSNALYIGINPVVVDGLREQWEVYSTTSKDASWYQESIEYQEYLGVQALDDRPQVETDDPNLDLSTGVANHIYDFHRTNIGKGIVSPKDDWYLPIWQTSPVTKRSMVNQNRASNSNASTTCLEDHKVVFEGMQYSTPGYGDDVNPRTAEIAWMLSMANQKTTLYEGDIYSTVFFPLYNNFSVNRTTVGVMRLVIHWARYFRDILPESVRGVVVVLENFCDLPYTYQINGGNVILLGHGDLHDSKFDDMVRYASFSNITSIADGTKEGMTLHGDECPYSIRVYPSKTFYDNYHSSIPWVITCAVAIVFIYTVIVFYVYDRQVEHRQRLLLNKATQSHKIVASLFPKNVRDRLLEENNDFYKKGSTFMAPNQRLKTFLDGNENTAGQAPIADVFLHATVLFADIAGFTAWSSSREPAQVFILLQTLYQAFDEIAKRRRVFKVETIGDSYVAVTGVPEPQANHAVIMARFAAECIIKMQEVVRDLEITLGPGTGELSTRIGINSGPVTAGVLRGERSRFQLFGDTINTASRMESTGVPGKIQASQSTVDFLTKAGKAHWVRKREDNVLAKGKGVLQTFWVTPHAKKGTSGSSDSGTSDRLAIIPDHPNGIKKSDILKHERQIDWMVELLQDSIRNIVAQRLVTKKVCVPPSDIPETQHLIALDEVVEAVQLPAFDSIAATANAGMVKISDEITALLREYVAIIASAYRDNPFHNFEHACHVTMSVSKFLKRIVTPELAMEELGDMKDENMVAKQIASHLYDYTHGINSDPITIFAIVFSALIHDVDHRGVSNVQLMKEEPHMAQAFRNKSIAEQNSLEIAWALLMSERFKDLRHYVFADEEDLKRFRQVIVNVVLATDIFDKELNDLRKARWSKAFSEQSAPVVTQDKNALRATIVMEHIMQASDVCHTMQHWHIYRKWNEKLFHEMLSAYRAGKMAADPASFWYTGELGFFDNYIIPLSYKLKECNVFGVSSDECLNYALRNRAEWEARGQEIVEEMLEKFNANTAAAEAMTAAATAA